MSPRSARPPTHAKSYVSDVLKPSSESGAFVPQAPDVRVLRCWRRGRNALSRSAPICYRLTTFGTAPGGCHAAGNYHPGWLESIRLPHSPEVAATEYRGGCRSASRVVASIHAK